ncbi:MAG: peptidyl-alpha-hydroxyglycine alpha-amidating lyase family protein [Bryobacteraceae bacterium]
MKVPLMKALMTRYLSCTSVLAAMLLSVQPQFAQGPGANPAMLKAKAENVPEIPFENVPDFVKLPPGVNFGESVGVATNSKGHTFVYDRAYETHLYEFDQNGKFLRLIGEGLYGFAFAHVVRIDPHDNIWAVDEGTNMIIKFNPDGQVLMLLGRRPETHQVESSPPPGYRPPPAQPYTFNRPTDVCWDAAEDIFVSDGYGNSRVAKYDKNGRFIKSVGSFGNQPYEFNTPHSIACDHNGNVYVADRGNRRIQVFDSDLVLRAIYDQVGAPWAVCITPGPHQYLYSSNSNPNNSPPAATAVTGEIYKMELDGTIVGKFGKGGKLPGEFGTIHEMDCRTDNELTVGEITSWRPQRIKLHPKN